MIYDGINSALMNMRELLELWTRTRVTWVVCRTGDLSFFFISYIIYYFFLKKCPSLAGCSDVQCCCHWIA